MSQGSSSSGAERGRKRPAQAALDALHCPVCLGPFDTGAHRPLSLVCGHSLCSACTEALPYLGPCPICRKVGPTQDRPTNFGLLQLLDGQVKVYSCKDCERSVEVEDAWVCRELFCVRSAAPDLVHLSCSRCFVSEHQSHPRDPLSKALAEARKAMGAKLNSLLANSHFLRLMFAEANQSLDTLWQTTASNKLSYIVKQPLANMKRELSELSRTKTELLSQAESLIGRFRAGELDSELLKAPGELDPEAVRLSMGACKKKLGSLKASSGRLRRAMVAFVTVAEDVGKETGKGSAAEESTG